MMHISWNRLHPGRLMEAQSNAEIAKSRSRDNSTEIRFLTERVERLSLLTHALWELLQQHSGFTDEELAGKIEEIDLRDGTLNGKFVRQPSTCASCGRRSGRKFTECMYCGADLGRGPVE